MTTDTATLWNEAFDMAKSQGWPDDLAGRIADAATGANPNADRLTATTRTNLAKLWVLSAPFDTADAARKAGAPSDLAADLASARLSPEQAAALVQRAQRDARGALTPSGIADTRRAALDAVAWRSSPRRPRYH
jgi:hypothetical protein